MLLRVDELNGDEDEKAEWFMEAEKFMNSRQGGDFSRTVKLHCHVI